MLKKICLLLISLNLGLFFSFGDTLRLTHDGNVRVEPSANSSVIQAVKKDSHIEGYIYNKDWYKVSLGKKKGYLHRTVAAVELKDVHDFYYIDDYNASEDSINNQCWIYKPFVKFIEFHPRWSVFIGIILCVISFIIVFIFLEHLPFKILRILCVVFIIFTVIGMFGSCTKPSTIKASWENSWSLFNGYTYEITESEFIYKDKENHSITFPYKIEDDVICLSPATKGDFGLLPPIEREFQYVKQGRFLTLFFDIPEKCISTASKEMSRIGILGVIGDVIVPAVAIVVAVLTNNESNTHNVAQEVDKNTGENLTQQQIKERQDYADNVALKYNTQHKNTPYESGIKKGLIGIEQTKNGGVDFRNAKKYLYKENGVNPVVESELTGNRDRDRREALKKMGIKPIKNKQGRWVYRPPDGFEVHHVDNLKYKNNKNGKSVPYCTYELITEDAHNKTRPHLGGFEQYGKIIDKYGM